MANLSTDPGGLDPTPKNNDFEPRKRAEAEGAYADLYKAFRVDNPWSAKAEPSEEGWEWFRRGLDDQRHREP
jgi:hypothetical protein